MQTRFTKPALSALILGIMLLALIGLATLAEYLGRIDFGIDQLLIREETLLEGDLPGRMAILTAVNFALLGATLLFLNHNNKRLVPVVHALTLMIAQ